MKQFFINLGKFFRIIDSNHELSLTYISMWVCIVKLALAHDPSFADIGALFVSTLAYSGKKYLASKTPQVVSFSPEIQDKIEKIEANVKLAMDKANAAKMAAGFRAPGQ